MFEITSNPEEGIVVSTIIVRYEKNPTFWTRLCCSVYFGSVVLYIIQTDDDLTSCSCKELKSKIFDFLHADPPRDFNYIFRGSQHDFGIYDADYRRINNSELIFFQVYPVLHFTT